MRYLVANKKNIDRLANDDLLYEILAMRGVENPRELLNLSPNVLCDAYDFRNIDDAVDLFFRHVGWLKDNIHIIIDSDVDGLTSASTVYEYIKRYSGIECTYDTHTKKQHGLYEEIVARIPDGTDLVIIPDAGSDERSRKWIEYIVDHECDVIVLDHHEISGWDDDCIYESDKGYKAIIINNQDGYYNNPTLSGVGVVFKFLEIVDDRYSHPDVEARDFLGYVALGMIADLMDLRNPETRFLTLSGLKYLTEDSCLLDAIVQHNSYAIQDKITIQSVGWNVAPLLNACFRQGAREDKLDMFEAMVSIGSDRTYVYQPTRPSKNNPNKEPIEEDLVHHMIRVMETLKREQDRQKKENTKILIKIIEDTNLKDSKIIILDTTGIINPTHTGITANELAKRYQRPVLLLTEYNDEEYGGSGRNYDKFELDNLNEFVCNSGLAEANGHNNSFGLKIRKDNVDNFMEYCNRELADADIRPIYHVDFEIPITRLKEKHVKQVGKWQDLFGGKGMDAPLFAITGIHIDSTDIKLLKNLMKFEVEINGQNLTFIRKFTSADLYKEIIHEATITRGNRSGESGNKKLDITIIGRFTINEWNGKEYPQIEIVEIETEISKDNKRRRRL